MGDFIKQMFGETIVNRVEKIKNYIQKIEKCDFECEAGNLRGCQEWIDLKKEVYMLGTNNVGKNHIEKMEEELQELEEKIEKLEIFLEKETENPKFTDEEQRTNLALQRKSMKDYAEILKCRIHYDTLKAHGEIEEKPCYVGDNYDAVTEECFK